MVASDGGNQDNATTEDTDDDELAVHLPKTNGNDVVQWYTDLEVVVEVGRLRQPERQLYALQSPWPIGQVVPSARDHPAPVSAKPN